MHRLIFGPIVLLFLHLAALGVRADRLEAIWIGPDGNGGEGNWSTPSNWNLGVIPTNGRDGNGDGLPDIYDVRIDGLPGVASLVHRGSAIAGLTLDVGDTLDLTASNLFLIDPDGEAEIVNNGNIRVSAPFQTNPQVMFGGNSLRLSGSGVMDLGTEFPQQGVIAPIEGGRLINGAGHTLRTTEQNTIGRIGAYVSPTLNFPATLTNEGTILAADRGKLELNLSAANHVNTGTIHTADEATIQIDSARAGVGRFSNLGRVVGSGNGRGVEIDGINFINESTGLVLAEDGQVAFNSSPGTFVRNAGLIEAVNGGGIRIEGTNIINEGQGVVQARAGGTIRLSNGIFRPDTTVRVLDAESRLVIGGDATFENDGNVLTAGPGKLFLDGGRIRGGELTSGLGQLEIDRPILENVRLTGTASGSGFNISGSVTIDTIFTASERMSLGTMGQDGSLRGSGISRFLAGADIRSTDSAIVVEHEHLSEFGSLAVHNGELRVNGTATSATGMGVFGGTLSGGGIVVSPYVHIVDGSISPGQGIGTLRLLGDLAFFGSEAQFFAELEGSDSDLLQIVGNIGLDGPFDELVLDGGLLGQAYTVCQYTGDRTGTFDSVTPGYNVIYDDVAKQIRVEVIPEPATLISLIAAFLTCLAIAGRRGFFAWLKKCP